MKFSIALASEVDSWRWVKRAEDLGFHAAWFYDTQLLNPDVFVCMALAAHETKTIRLGTGVLVPTNRIEPVTANALASLNKLAPGRIDFGVGTGFTARRTMGLNAFPLAKTKTYVQRVRALLRGETIDWDYEGKDRKIRFLNPDLGLIDIEHDIPFWFSALGPRARRLTAELQAGWFNTGPLGAEQALQDMREIWCGAGNDPDTLESNMLVLGAVLDGDHASDEAKLMAQAAPYTCVLFHAMADAAGGGLAGLPPGPVGDPAAQALGEALADYLKAYEAYRPADARYLSNHRGHLMFVRPEETHVTPDLVRATTLSGTHDELVQRLRDLRAAGYSQLTLQLVRGHESAIEDWANVFHAV